MNYLLITVCCLAIGTYSIAQKKKTAEAPPPPAQISVVDSAASNYLKPVKWRNIGPFRGGRSVTSCGVIGNPLVYYMGTTGGGVWKTTDAGQSWVNISDGYFKTGSVGAVAVAESDPNVVYVGMGEHAPRGVMTSYGDGVYKSTDAGKTWKHLGLDLTRHISWIRIHPTNPDVVYVAAQGALHGPNPERGIYKSTDGGTTWRKVLYVDANTGCADLSLDMNNPRILYAAMWDHRRLPWEVRSGGKGSGLYKSTDGGETWTRMSKGLPAELGKMSIEVSRANSEKVYALVESDTEKEQGGLFVSYDAGDNWTRISKDHRLVQRAWYYIEVFADPQQENTVYVLNSPGLKSTDGGRTWTNIRGTHGDYHQLWINPKNSQNMIVSNDGGAAVTFNGGDIWTTQNNQPTAQFYRVNADNLFPYNLYGGQQDNTSVKIASRTTGWGGIGERDWSYSAGGESAFLAFDPNNPTQVMGGSYQGTVELRDINSKEGVGIMVSPIQYQALQPKDMKYRFNWNAPIIWSRHEPNTWYHAGNILFKTSNGGKTWKAVSPDLTRNDKSKQGMSGTPYTNEGAGGENYGTLAYVLESPLEKGVIYTGSDDGLLQLTRDGGNTWTNITPPGLDECLVNCIEVSPHDKATVYIATTRYKVNDFTPSLLKSSDYGKTWSRINSNIPYGAFTRCLREDDVQKGLLYCGTETGFYVSWDDGNNWKQLQMGLPITPITDLKVHKGDLLAATMGRSFWILDDLNMLRQYANRAPKGSMHLYTPEDAVRVFASSPLDAPGNDPAGKPRAAFSGTNPASGIVFYYQLPDSLKKDEELTLEIMDSKGGLVRKYSSKEDPEFKSYPGGPSADPVLNTNHHLNRFVWDGRYPTLLGAPTTFIEGSYEGHKAPPGNYTAKLSLGGQSKTVTFKVLPHPGIKATEADYAMQHEWISKVEADINDVHASVVRMRKVKIQIKDLLGLLGTDNQYEDVQKQGKALVEKLSKWEDELVQNKSQSNDDVINFVNKLSADMIFVKGEMDNNIPLVTDGAKERYAELHAEWMKLKQQMNDMVNSEISAFNKHCAAAGVTNVVVPK